MTENWNWLMQRKHEFLVKLKFLQTQTPDVLLGDAACTEASSNFKDKFTTVVKDKTIRSHLFGFMSALAA